MNLSNEAPRPSLEYYPDIEQKRATLLAALTRTGTPIFLGERENLTDRCQALIGSLGAHWGQHVVGYSFKTNYLVAKCGIFRECGNDSDVLQNVRSRWSSRWVGVWAACDY